jgi:hypothetical protein
MVWVMGMSRGAGAGFVPAAGDVDGEAEDVVERDNDERSLGRAFGLGDGGRGEFGPRDPVLTDDLTALSADEMLIDGVLMF